MAVNTSRSEVDRGHAILNAIAGFRDEVNRLIDEQKAGLFSPAFESEGDLSEETAGIRAQGFEVTASPRGESTIPSRARSVPQPSASPSPRSESLPVARPPGLFPEPAEPNPTPHTDDPRQRLDALAKLLDRRRKPAGTSMADAAVGAVEEKAS